MKLDYKFDRAELERARNSKKTDAEKAIASFLKSGQDAAMIRFSGSIETAYQYLFVARKKNGFPVTISRRNGKLFILKKED